VLTVAIGQDQQDIAAFGSWAGNQSRRIMSQVAGPEATTPGGIGPENPLPDQPGQGTTNKRVGSAWEKTVRNAVGGKNVHMDRLGNLGTTTHSVEFDSLVEGVGDYEAKAINWGAKSYQGTAGRSALTTRLKYMAEELNLRRSILLNRGLGEKLTVWFRDAPLDDAAMTQQEIEAYLTREVKDLLVKWGQP